MCALTSPVVILGRYAFEGRKRGHVGRGGWFYRLRSRRIDVEEADTKGRIIQQTRGNSAQSGKSTGTRKNYGNSGKLGNIYLKNVKNLKEKNCGQPFF